MKTASDISTKMIIIREIFENSKSLVEQEEDINSIIEKLNNTSIEFRSVAYEGASMGFALKDFLIGNSLSQWHNFMNDFGKNHLAQVHVGLGWAIAHQGNSAIASLEFIEPLMQSRVIDGCGFYDGIFRKGQSIKRQKTITVFPEIFSPAYDQGIGRSIWYICKGDIESTVKLIENYSPERQTGIWRGIGVAVANVGECDSDLLRLLFNMAEKNVGHLSVGAILTAYSRHKSNSITKGVEIACNNWCNLSVREAVSLAKKTEAATDMKQLNAFEQWVSKIERELVPEYFIHQIN